MSFPACVLKSLSAHFHVFPSRCFWEIVTNMSLFEPFHSTPTSTSLMLRKFWHARIRCPISVILNMKLTLPFCPLSCGSKFIFLRIREKYLTFLVFLLYLVPRTVFCHANFDSTRRKICLPLGCSWGWEETSPKTAKKMIGLFILLDTSLKLHTSHH